MKTPEELEQLVACVREMHAAEDAINTLLLQQFHTLLDDELTVKQSLLLDIVERRAPVTVRDIADAMQVTSSAISQIVGKLERAGYVKREINVHNRREIFVHLGRRGEALVAKRERIQREMIERFYAKMGLDDVRLLRDLTFKLQAVVEEEIRNS